MKRPGVIQFLIIILTSIIFTGCSEQNISPPGPTLVTPTQTPAPQEVTAVPTLAPTETEIPPILSQPLSYIGFDDEKNRLLIMDTDGAVKLIVDGLGTIFGYHWSPDGQQILVEAYDGELTDNTESKLFLVEADGSGYVQIFETYPIIHLLGTGWSPSGDRLYLLTKETLLIADLRTETITQILDPGYYSYVSWSPDGQTLLFDEYHNNFDFYSVDRVNADGSGFTVLSEGYDEEPYPVWSPDGSRIGFRGDGVINLMDADGSELLILLKAASTISWSPDGKDIAYLLFGASISSFDTKYSTLYPCVAEITHPEDQTCYPVAVDFVPTWSSDASQLLVQRIKMHFDNEWVFESETYVINLVLQEIISLPANMHYPKWIPFEP